MCWAGNPVEDPREPYDFHAFRSLDLMEPEAYGGAYAGNPDLGMFTAAYARYAAPGRPAVDHWITVDRDAEPRGLVGIYARVKDEYWAAVKAGKFPGLRDEGTGTDSTNVPLKAVGNTEYNGNNPPKYLNAEFNYVSVKDFSEMTPSSIPTGFGARRVCYNNFAEHLLNAYNPNMTYPGLPHRWSDDDWRACIDMLASFGFNVFEFWLVPRLFCREGLESDFGRGFARQMNLAGEHAHRRGMKLEVICALATVGSAWHTYCPNVADEWRELRFLWEQWLRRLPQADIVGLFPGDPGACSRNGCTALTYIDKCCEIAELARGVLPRAEIELSTWGPPFFGWGNLRGPEGWKGEFIQAWQHTAWDFDKQRADESMRHLVKRLPDFPDNTSVSLNMGFNSDGNPAGDQDARPWIREIARTNAVYTWDFSLTEGENAIVPHWRFERLFQRRREERDAGPYQGGICFTMTPKLNQLTLFMAAQSFLKPDAEPNAVAAEFLSAMLGPAGRELVPFLPLFEVIRDWGNYIEIKMPRDEYHAKLCAMREILESAAGRETDTYPLFPSPAAWREELLFFARLFADLSAPAPDYDALHDRYWRRVYGIYDHLPEHVDSRPRTAAKALVRHFVNWDRPAEAGPIPGKWQ